MAKIIQDINTKSYKIEAKPNPKDRIEVEIGDVKQPDLKPQVKIMRWDNEVNVSFRIKDFGDFTQTIKDSKVKLVNGKQEVHLYELENGFEFEVILKEKPQTNTIEFTLEDKDVDYFYQPALTQKEIDGGANRPENVIGSYAVYAKTPKTNYVGGKEYKCGKVGHIYRPRIEDSEGKWVWGELHIEDNLLTVTIPQEFLDKAVYPIRHAAGLTFGYASQGGSSAYTSADTVYLRTGTPESNGSCDSVSIYARTQYPATSNAWQGAIYNSTLGILSPQTDTGVVNNAFVALFTVNFTSGPSVVGSTQYFVACFLDHNAGSPTALYYDTGGVSGDSKIKAATYNSWPNPISSETDSTNIYSIYCTYTAGGGTETATVSPLGLTATTPSVTATHVSELSASITPLALTLTPPEITATYKESIPLIDALSGTDPGFANTVTPADTDPFNSGEKADYDVQAGDILNYSTEYFWRVRVIDPAGTNTWSDWSATRSFTTQASPIASVSPLALTLSSPEVTATYVYVQISSVSSLALSLTPPAVTATHASVWSGSVTPLVGQVSQPAVTATYAGIYSASVSPIETQITQPAVTATYAGIYSASVSPPILEVSVSEITATASVFAAMTSLLQIEISFPSVRGVGWARETPADASWTQETPTEASFSQETPTVASWTEEEPTSSSWTQEVPTNSDWSKET